jgi:4-hydroxy-tetrahydrodipicolinate reductase
MGRLGSAIAHGVSTADDMTLGGAYAPGHAGECVAGVDVEVSAQKIAAAVIVECTHPDAVMDNLRMWHSRAMRVVVGTSGFTNDRIEEVRTFWAEDDPGCLIVPNFSIGAVLMMSFAEMASAYFESAEIIERHEDTKPDAPSGTALATAVRISRNRHRPTPTVGGEVVKGARGGSVSGVRVHSLRMKGLLSDQEVAFSNSGETFSILHKSTSYASFVPGALLAIRYVHTMTGVQVGLDAALAAGPGKHL